MNNLEKSVLFSLISESKGLGAGVAVYPFETTLRKIISNPVDAKLVIYSLQKLGYLTLSEKEGYDHLRDKAAMYPVYIVTEKGFEAALEIRKSEQYITDKIESGSLDDIDLPNFLLDEESGESEE
jgi:hypothetical protein